MSMSCSVVLVHAKQSAEFSWIQTFPATRRSISDGDSTTRTSARFSGTPSALNFIFLSKDPQALGIIAAEVCNACVHAMESTNKKPQRGVVGGAAKKKPCR